MGLIALKKRVYGILKSRRIRVFLSFLNRRPSSQKVDLAATLSFPQAIKFHRECRP